MGEMKELPDYRPSDRNTNVSENDIELDPRRQSYTSSTIGELNSGSFPLAQFKENKKKQIAPEKRPSFVKRNLNISIP